MTSSSSWQAPPEHLSLACDVVHVWLARLKQPAARARALLELLSPDERERAARFRFERDRESFINARGILRTLLGRYLEQEPASLRFDYNAYGKPSLAGASAATTALRFNLSHAHQLALYAFAREREVGIDLEYMREEFACEEIAGRFFSEREVEGLRGLAEDRRKEGFFNCWTRKEAYIKARGLGLSLPLDEFDVSLAPGEPAALLDVRDEPLELQRWSLRELMPAAGYAAAVAVEGSGWRLECWRWGE
ncbi:MAG TPA: 4'-phosphopantetheinyl transferase superfamily protein [Pyrinomonadaceae bacterium]|jgi:4'-phosphopantetheinyl transferase